MDKIPIFKFQYSFEKCTFGEEIALVYFLVGRVMKFNSFG